MVQETHFRPGGSFKFASKHFPKTYIASDPSGKAGVAILFKRSCPIRITSSCLDPHGRFVLLNCSYLNTHFTLANIYAPNVGQIGFLTTVFEKLQTFSQPFMIIGGDFNVCMSPTKDRYALFQDTPQTAVQKLYASFRKLIRSHNLFDTWRIQHPTQKSYFYSPPLKLYSRLDYFLVTAPLLPYIVSSEIALITWSDHARIELDLILSTLTPKTCHWRLNESLLRNPMTQTQLQQKLNLI